MPFSISSSFLLAQLRQILVRPSVRPDRMPGGRNLLQDFGMPHGVFTDREEERLVHCSASAFSTAGVFPGHGPSSNVSTTSLSRRKS